MIPFTLGLYIEILFMNRFESLLKYDIFDTYRDTFRYWVHIEYRPIVILGPNTDTKLLLMFIPVLLKLILFLNNVMTYMILMILE